MTEPDENACPTAGRRSGHGPQERFAALAALGKDDLDTAVDLLVAGLYQLAEAGGLDPDEAHRAVHETLSYAQRRLRGEVMVDDFGFDQDFTRHVYLPALRPLFRSWFRTQVTGAENVPETGGALIAANHAGTIALDAVMTQVAVHDAHPQNRFLRLLAGEVVFRLPFVGEVARRAGATAAGRDDARLLLTAGELVGVWPEGYKGVGKPFSERYRLQRFGRGGFITSALAADAPIIPCAIVGSEEAYPLLTDIEPLAKLFGLPYFPVTPLFPHMGLLGLVPLPSKWMIRFGRPIWPSAELGVTPNGSGRVPYVDPARMFELTDRIREIVQQMVYDLLEERGSAFAR